MDQRPTTCLVTGGAGFIGSHIVDALLSQGHRVRVVDNLSTGSRENLAHVADRVEVIVADLQDPAVAEQATEGIEVVFHLAARGSVPRSLKDPWGSHDANVNATVRLLEAARQAGVRRVVYSSSSSVYGDTPTLPKVETMAPQCRSPYAAGKLSAEQYTLAYSRSGLVEGVALRYFNIFGPRQSPEGAYAAVIPRFMAAAASGAAAHIEGDGEQTRDFTYVDNAVHANLLAAFGPSELVTNTAFNVGAGARTSLLDLIGYLREITGSELPVAHGPSRHGDVRDSLAGLEHASERLGYAPKVSVRDGLQRTWEWFIGERSRQNATS